MKNNNEIFKAMGKLQSILEKIRADLGKIPEEDQKLIADINDYLGAITAQQMEVEENPDQSFFQAPFLAMLKNEYLPQQAKEEADKIVNLIKQANASSHNEEENNSVLASKLQELKGIFESHINDLCRTDTPSEKTILLNFLMECNENINAPRKLIPLLQKLSSYPAFSELLSGVLKDLKEQFPNSFLEGKNQSNQSSFSSVFTPIKLSARSLIPRRLFSDNETTLPETDVDENNNNASSYDFITAKFQGNEKLHKIPKLKHHSNASPIYEYKIDPDDLSDTDDSDKEQMDGLDAKAAQLLMEEKVKEPEVVSGEETDDDETLLAKQLSMETPSEKIKAP